MEMTMQMQDSEPKLVAEWRAQFSASAGLAKAFGSAERYVAWQASARFSRSAALQAEFGSAERYAAYLGGRNNAGRSDAPAVDMTAVLSEVAALASVARAEGMLAGEWGRPG
jgi:hypothetical protein